VHKKYYILSQIFILQAMSDDNGDLNSMLCLDIYLSSLSDNEYGKIKHKIKSRRVFPVTSWDISANFLQKPASQYMQEADRIHLVKLSKQLRWKLDIDSFVNEAYDAIIVTNTRQEIYWVNDGFTAMTGYAPEHALGKKPNFLQGKNTPQEVRENIREQLLQLKPFACTVINYRKNHEQYLCEVKIIPISNDKDKVTHFIAFEREAV